VSLRTTSAGALAAVLLSAACSATSPGKPTDRSLTQTHVDVDTPALRAAKKAAGVEQCSPGTGSASHTMPAVTLPCLGGGPAVDLARLKGPLVINLFAQWCGPCREEMPFYQQLSEKGRGKVAVLGIDYLDTQPGRAVDLVSQSGVTYPLLADPASDLRAPFRIHGLPGVILVDAHGEVADVEFMVIRSFAQLAHLVRQKLGVTV
jgi:thiol-disulfide isomerase/thioredoxin